jgi:hypothetical protein
MELIYFLRNWALRKLRQPYPWVAPAGSVGRTESVGRTCRVRPLGGLTLRFGTFHLRPTVDRLVAS